MTQSLLHPRSVARYALILLGLAAAAVALLLVGARTSAAQSADLSNVEVRDLTLLDRTSPIETLTWTWDVSDPGAISGYEAVLTASSDADRENADSYYVGAALAKFSVPLPQAGNWCFSVRAIDQTNRSVEDGTKATAWSSAPCINVQASEVLRTGIDPDTNKPELLRQPIQGPDRLRAQPITIEAEKFDADGAEWQRHHSHCL